MDNTTSEEEQQAKARQRRKRRLEEDKSQDRRKLDRTKEDIKQAQKAQQAALYKLERDIDDTKTLDDINKINISNYKLPTNKKEAIQDKYNKRKQELEVEKYERELDDAKAKQAPARTAAKALPLFLQPLANYFLDKGISKEQKNLKKAKKKKRKVFLNVTGIMAAASGFLFLTLLLLVIAVGSITSILLSHPEAIRELYENNLLGDALYMGNVTEDVVVDGKVIVKGNPASRPGCFIYNGVWYCGNCKVVNEGQEQSNCQEGTTNYDSAGQGDLTVEATQWAKTFEASFIGDSLGVGVQTELVKYIPKLHYDVLSSRWLIYQSADSTDPLNGLQALRTLKEDDNLKEVLIVALGTNGGLKQDDLKTFISEVPDTVKSIIFINSGSQGGSGDYGKIDTEDISKQIKELSKTNQKVSYLDWLTYSQKEGWDKLTSDSVHLNDTGNQVYAKFITQGLYDILVNIKNNTCSVDSQNIRDNKDDSKGTTETFNAQSPETFYCPENCVITEQEKALGTGNIKAIQKGKIWQNDNILLTDLGYTADTVTPQAIDEYINTVAPNDNGIKGMGAVFYEAGQKSGYDPRYILAHMIHETNWGRSTIWKDKNNAFGWMAYDDTPYDSAKDFETKEKGIIEGAQMIYKNYYVDHSQKNLKDMHRDPDTTRNHNYATDPQWHTKIGAIMLSMEKTMGPSTGGSVVQGSNNGQQATTPTGLNLGRSCLINDVTFNNLPYPPEQMSISSFYHDANYGISDTHGGADMTYTHGGSGPIYSVDSGEVTDVMTTCSVGNSACGGGWGNYIKIKHTGVADGQYETQYAHLESGSIKVKIGDTVTAGQEIGTMGTTGFSTGIHLHFELWYNGSRIDSYPYFSWKDATYEPGWENYKGPHTGELCVPGATQKGQQSSDNRSQTCDITDGSTKVPSSGLIGSDNPEKVYNFFKGHGFSDAAIAGILGNLKQESDVQSRLVQGIYDKSTYTMSDEELDKIMKRSIVIWSDPNMPGEGIGPAMGVSQWEHTAFYNGALQPGRWENLMAWAKKNGYSHWDLEAQLEYIIREMGIVKDPDVPLEYGTSLINNGGPWSRGFVGITGMENFQKATDVTKATYTYFQYNRAGTPHMDNRIAYAKEFYAQMGNWS